MDPKKATDVSVEAMEAPENESEKTSILRHPQRKSLRMGKYAKRVLANCRESRVVPSIEQPILGKPRPKECNGQIQLPTEYFMNRRIPNGTYGGVRGRELITPSYSIE
ncbi:hypothetical protein D3C73_1194410 [compost metagenome]